MKNPFDLTATFEGHRMALAVAGQVLFGVLPKHTDEQANADLASAIVMSGNTWIGSLLNKSDAVKGGMAALRAMPLEKAKEDFTTIAAIASAAFMQEFGGLVGLADARAKVQAGLDESIRQKLHAHQEEGFLDEGTKADGEVEAKVHTLDLSEGADVAAQLKAAGLPAEMADLLAGIKDAVNGKGDAAKPTVQ